MAILRGGSTVGGYLIADVRGNGANGTWNISITGNAATATKLKTPVTINGQSFDGSGNITVSDTTKLPLAGGTLTGGIVLPAGNTVAAVTSANSAYLDFGMTQTNGGGFVPFMHGRTQVSAGYIQHITIGGYRAGGSNWTGGLFIGIGGNDSYPTESFALNYGGSITHSTSGTFLNSSNFNSYVPSLTGSNASGTWAISITGSAALASSANALGGLPLATANPTWGSIPSIQAGGGFEIGRYIDFHGSSAGAEDFTVRFDGGGPGSTTLTLTGNFTATAEITAYSDARIKTNVETVPSALNKVTMLRGVYFDRTDIEGPRQMGVIAQEVQQIIPEVVRSDDNGRLSVAYGNLAGLFIEAIKELRKDNEELKQRIAVLEAK